MNMLALTIILPFIGFVLLAFSVVVGQKICPLPWVSGRLVWPRW